MQRRRLLMMKFSSLLEFALSAVIIIAVILGTFDTLRIMWETYIINFNEPIDYDQINAIFAQILLLVIGVEIAIMLTLHIPSALLEVLLYAIARKMLLASNGHGMLDVLLGVAAIGGLFLIRRFLLEHNCQDPKVARFTMFDEVDKNPDK